MASSPFTEPPSPAESAFAEFLRRGKPEDWESVLKRHPQEANELQVMHQAWILFQEGTSAPSACAEESAHLLEVLDGIRGGDPRYEVGPDIGRGGMGWVSRVRDRALSRDLAMKVAGQVAGRTGGNTGKNPQASQTPTHSRVARFLDEARLTGSLDHPGIVPVHDLGIDADGRAFFTMRLIEGQTLKKHLQDRQDAGSGRSLSRVLGMLLRVSEAVAFAHSKCVIHLDLKPSNVMIGIFGEVYVVDWGLARVDAERAAEVDVNAEIGRDQSSCPPLPAAAPPRIGDVMGTPSYMSPEQALGHVGDLDSRADVYSLGAILYEMLTGTAPYQDGDQGRAGPLVVAAVRRGRPTPVSALAPAVSPELVSICERAMARRASDRYCSASQFADDLRAFLEDDLVCAHPTGSVLRLRKWARRHPRESVTVALGTLGLVAAALLSVFTWLGIVGRTREAVDQGDLVSLGALSGSFHGRGLGSVFGRAMLDEGSTSIVDALSPGCASPCAKTLAQVRLGERAGALEAAGWLRVDRMGPQSLKLLEWTVDDLADPHLGLAREHSGGQLDPAQRAFLWRFLCREDSNLDLAARVLVESPSGRLDLVDHLPPQVASRLLHEVGGSTPNSRSPKWDLVAQGAGGSLVRLVEGYRPRAQWSDDWHLQYSSALSTAILRQAGLGRRIPDDIVEALIGFCTEGGGRSSLGPTRALLLYDVFGEYPLPAQARTRLEGAAGEEPFWRYSTARATGDYSAFDESMRLWAASVSRDEASGISASPEPWGILYSRGVPEVGAVELPADWGLTPHQRGRFIDGLWIGWLIASDEIPAETGGATDPRSNLWPQLGFPESLGWVAWESVKGALPRDVPGVQAQWCLRQLPVALAGGACGIQGRFVDQAGTIHTRMSHHSLMREGLSEMTFEFRLPTPELTDYRRLSLALSHCSASRNALPDRGEARIQIQLDGRFIAAVPVTVHGFATLQVPLPVRIIADGQVHQISLKLLEANTSYWIEWARLVRADS